MYNVFIHYYCPPKCLVWFAFNVILCLLYVLLVIFLFLCEKIVMRKYIIFTISSI